MVSARAASRRWLHLVAEVQAGPLSTGFPSGEQHPNAKLTAAQVVRVFEMHRDGKGPTEIAKAVGVQKACISKILNGHRRRRSGRGGFLKRGSDGG